VWLFVGILFRSRNALLDDMSARVGGWLKEMLASEERRKWMV